MPKINEINVCLQKLINKTKHLTSLFWSNEELEELKHHVDFLEQRIQGTIKATIINFNWYQQEGWKKFVNGNKREYDE